MPPDSTITTEHLGLAEDLKHGRQVAIKVLRRDLLAAAGADRFVREIRLAARPARAILDDLRRRVGV